MKYGYVIWDELMNLIIYIMLMIVTYIEMSIDLCSKSENKVGLNMFEHEIWLNIDLN